MLHLLNRFYLNVFPTEKHNFSKLKAELHSCPLARPKNHIGINQMILLFLQYEVTIRENRKG